jgi:hypothetical protein
MTDVAGSEILLTGENHVSIATPRRLLFAIVAVDRSVGTTGEQRKYHRLEILRISQRKKKTHPLLVLQNETLARSPFHGWNPLKTLRFVFETNIIVFAWPSQRP